MKFGCHVSIRHGYLKAAEDAYQIGARCFQYFPKNPRSMQMKDFDVHDAKGCREFCQQNELISVAHTSYPTSLTPANDKKQLTLDSLRNDLEIAEACGSIGLVVHFGQNIFPTEPLRSYQLMIEMLNQVLSNWDGQAKILIENVAGGNFGVTLEELTQIRNLTEVSHQIGFCLDTCHAFASGLWTGDNTEVFLSKGVELGYFDHLMAVHLNNSKYPVGSQKDRHANIFKDQYIKLEQFDTLLTSRPFGELPLILETPKDEGMTHEQELAHLYQRYEER